MNNGHIKYLIYQELELILVRYEGEITTNLIEKHISKLSSDNNYNPNFQVIADLRKSKLLIESINLNYIVSKVIENEKVIGRRKQAYIIKTDEQLALSSLFTMLVRELPMKISIVETVREALEWIELDIIELDSINEKFFTIKKD